jgi:hypothetical protein
MTTKTWGLRNKTAGKPEQSPYKEDLFTTFIVHSALLLLSIFFYAILRYKLLWMLIGYFGANILFLGASIFFAFLSTRREHRCEQKIPDGGRTVSAEKAPLPLETKGEKAQKRVQIGIRRREGAKKSRKLTIRMYDEYAQEFGLTKTLEKDFKSWVLTHVIAAVLRRARPADSSVQGQGRATLKNITNEDMDVAQLINNNGLVCYDRNNHVHSKALFKLLYNHFNTQMPNCGSYYINPMDEFVFEDINKLRISNFGLLVEETESFLESKKLFNLYFLSRNIVYDCEGDVVLAFLLLLMYANTHSGGYLGSLSLRQFKFLY